MSKSSADNQDIYTRIINLLLKGRLINGHIPQTAKEKSQYMDQLDDLEVEISTSVPKRNPKDEKLPESLTPSVLDFGHEYNGITLINCLVLQDNHRFIEILINRYDALYKEANPSQNPHGTLLNTSFNDKPLPAHYAAYHGNKKMLSYLRGLGADLSLYDVVGKNNIAHFAAKNNHNLSEFCRTNGLLDILQQQNKKGEIPDNILYPSLDAKNEEVSKSKSSSSISDQVKKKKRKAESVLDNKSKNEEFAMPEPRKSRKKLKTKGNNPKTNIQAPEASQTDNKPLSKLTR